MISTSDIETILLGEFSVLGIPCKADPSVIDDFEVNGIGEDTVIVLVKKQDTDTYWYKGFVEVNICVPNYKSGKRNFNKLRNYEREVNEMLKTSVVGEFDGTSYRYSKESIGVERDEKMRCHYVNVRLLFEIFNIV